MILLDKCDIVRLVAGFTCRTLSGLLLLLSLGPGDLKFLLQSLAVGQLDQFVDSSLERDYTYFGKSLGKDTLL